MDSRGSIKEERIKIMKNEIVYGVFYKEDYNGELLMGLYFTNEEAEAARDEYIKQESNKVTKSHYEFAVQVRPLKTGLKASYFFAN